MVTFMSSLDVSSSQ